MVSALRSYFLLTKPGIIFGNLVTMLGGFALASQGRFQGGVFWATFLGLSCVIASACVCNNCIDRHLDQLMERTKKRPLVIGAVSLQSALFLALVLMLLGTGLLLRYTTLLATSAAVIGWILYVSVYSPMKYKSHHATLVGSLAGALPPVVGYTAVNPKVNLCALLLFVLVAFWQMPHFYAIALGRMEEYKQGNIPILPLEKGILVTKLQMLGYLVGFIGISLAFFFLGYKGSLYMVGASLLGGSWLLAALLGFNSKNLHLWARRMFIASLIVVMGVCILLGST